MLIRWEIDLAYNQNCQRRTSEPLAEALAHDYANLQRYVGDDSFNLLARAFATAQTTAPTTGRLHFKLLPQFLLTYKPFLRAPEIQELAALELALQIAFESPDRSTFALTDLEKLGPNLQFRLHPSTQFLDFFQNTTSLWSAIICGQQPPKPHRLDHAQQLIVWRQGAGARFRILGDEEALALKAGTMKLAQNYLRSWVEAELLLRADPTADKVEK